VDKIHPFQL